MRKPTMLVLRLSGVIFFVGAMALGFLNVFDTSLSTLGYILSEGSEIFWNVYFLVMGSIYVSSFALFLFSTGTAALFGGKRGFTQSVFNSGVYSLVALSFYSSINILTGVDEDLSAALLSVLVPSIIMEISFCVITFFCLRDTSESDEAEGGVDTSAFSFSKIFSLDDNMRITLKALLAFLVLIWGAAFIMVHQ